MREVGLDVGHGFRLRDLGELPRREQPLAGGQRAIDAPRDIGHGARVARLDDLLAKQRPDRSDGFHIGDRGVERVGRPWKSTMMSTCSPTRSRTACASFSTWRTAAIGAS